MAERIELPPTLQGDEKSQLQQLWSYLYQMSESLNNNLQAIGSNDLTDDDRMIMQKIIQQAGESAQQFTEMETLKSLIIKTADFVQTSLQEYRLNLLGESVASGQFGRYVRHTGLDVEVTPEGITQNYSFEEVVQGLKEFSVNAKNYIKTGLLRTVNGLPVYGVAIGKNVVTFSEDGVETYNDENKVAELTAEELSFWQDSVKIASYKEDKISFLYNGSDAFYIQNGKIYCSNDLELTSGNNLIIKSGGKLKVESGGEIDINATGDLKLSGSQVEIKSGSTLEVDSQNLYIDSDLGNIATRSSLFNNALILIGYETAKHFGEKLLINLTPASVRQTINGVERSAYSCYLSIDDEYTDPSYKRSSVFRVGVKRERTFFDVSDLFSHIEIDGTKTDKNTSENTWDFPILDARNIDSQYAQISNLRATNIRYSVLNQNSSRDIKHDIKPMVSMGEQLDRLLPVTFVYDEDQDENIRAGLIYEDTLEVMPEICSKDEGNKTINYVELIPMLLKEIQDLRARVKALEERGGN